MTTRLVSAAIVFLGLLSTLLFSLELRPELADWLNGRDRSPATLALLFLVFLGTLITPQLAWAGFGAFVLGGGLALLYVVEDGGGAAAWIGLATLAVAVALSVWLASLQGAD